MSNLANVSGGHNYDHLAAQVGTFLESYRPRKAGDWAELGPTVLQLVADTNPRSDKVAQGMLKLAYEFLIWIRDVGGREPDKESFTGRNIARFIENRGPSPLSPVSQREHNLLARIVETATGVRPRTPRQTDSRPHPYSAAEVAELWSAATMMPSSRLRTTLRQVLALGLGAGLRLREMEDVRVGDVRDGRVVLADRTVPILPSWRDDLDASTRPSGEFLLLPKLKRYARRGHLLGSFMHSVPGLAPETARLRATWLTGLLDSGVSVSVFRSVSGTAGFRLLDYYADFLHQPSAADVEAELIRIGAAA